MSESVQPQCPSCGKPVAAGRLRGLCAACLVKGISTPAAPPEEAEPQPPAAGVLFHIPGHDVVEEIARGGMGIVYRARQHHPAREVALKMLLPGGATAALRERFRNEARTMADLDHPGILPLYQFGEHGGTPWFTMKLASGGSLAERLRMENAPADPREAALLLASICDALAYAHERGVLHRDLKPGNILFDADGRACVADFGLAKLDSQSAAGLTHSRAMIGTPHYLAPELAAKAGTTATVASDVYALGAILYELLAGRPPFQAETLAGLLRSIVEDEPPSLLSLRGTAPGMMPRGLAAITGKAMAKEPGRRYASAAAFAADLRAWLAGEPIQARPPGTREKALRWVRRYPAWAASLALLTAGVAAYLVVQARVTRDLRQAADALQQERNTAVAARGEVEDLMSFMSDEVAQNMHPLGRLDILAPVAERACAYYDQLPPAPEDRARLGRQYRALLLLGNVQAERGQSDAAVASLQRALDIVRGLAAAEPEERHLLRMKGLLLRSMGDAHQDAGRFDQAEACCREALTECEAAVARDPSSTTAQMSLAVCLRSLGAALASLQRLDEAESIFTRAEKLCEEGLERMPGYPGWQQQVAFCEYRLGLLAAARQQWGHAAERFRRQVALLRVVVGDSRDVMERRPLALGLLELAAVTRELNDLDASVAAADEALTLSREFARHDRENADWQLGFIQALREAGLTALKRSGAEPAIGYLERARFLAVSMVERHPAHRQLREYQKLLTADLKGLKTGSWSAAQWMRAFESASRAGDVTAAHTTSTLGLFAEHAGGRLVEAGQLDEALAFYRQAAALVLPPEPGRVGMLGLRWEAAFYANRIAEVLEKQGRLEEALGEFRSALALRQEHLVANRSIKGGGRVVSSAGHVVRVLLALKRPGEAMDTVTQTADFLESKKLLGTKTPGDVGIPLSRTALAAAAAAERPGKAAAADFLKTLRPRLFGEPPHTPEHTAALQALDAALAGLAAP